MNRLADELSSRYDATSELKTQFTTPICSFIKPCSHMFLRLLQPVGHLKILENVDRQTRELA
jgi:hypothetical protein